MPEEGLELNFMDGKNKIKIYCPSGIAKTIKDYIEANPNTSYADLAREATRLELFEHLVITPLDTGPVYQSKLNEPSQES